MMLCLQMKETEHRGAESTQLRGGGACRFGSGVCGPENVGPGKASECEQYVKHSQGGDSTTISVL